MAPNIPNVIDCGACSLHFLTANDVWFVEELWDTSKNLCEKNSMNG